MKLIKPLMSEKTMSLAEKGWFSFTAPLNYTKNIVGLIIREEYKVTPLEISSIITKPEKRRRGKNNFMTRQTKKFMVKLPKGTKIPGYEAK